MILLHVNAIVVLISETFSFSHILHALLRAANLIGIGYPWVSDQVAVAWSLFRARIQHGIDQVFELVGKIKLSVSAPVCSLVCAEQMVQLVCTNHSRTTGDTIEASEGTALRDHREENDTQGKDIDGLAGVRSSLDDLWSHVTWRA